MEHVHAGCTDQPNKAVQGSQTALPLLSWAGRSHRLMSPMDCTKYKAIYGVSCFTFAFYPWAFCLTHTSQSGCSYDSAGVVTKVLPPKMVTDRGTCRWGAWEDYKMASVCLLCWLFPVSLLLEQHTWHWISLFVSLQFSLLLVAKNRKHQFTSWSARTLGKHTTDGTFRNAGRLCHWVF